MADRSWPLALALSLSLAAAASSPDWKGVGRMEGKVTDAAGRPLADVTVKLNLPSHGGTTARTNRKGRWTVGGIAPGDWDLEFEAPGYTSSKTTIHLTWEGARLPPIETRLEKTVPKGPPPELVETLRKADEAYKAGRFAEAVAEYEKLLALRTDLATTIHQQIGLAHLQLKSYDKALQHLQKVLDADPTNIQVRGIMVQAALEGGQLDRGMALLKTIDEAAIKHPEVFYNIGVHLLNANRPEDAIAYFTKAVGLDPAYVDGYFRRGLAYLQLQRLPECKADLLRVLELTPTGPQADAARTTLDQIK